MWVKYIAWAKVKKVLSKQPKSSSTDEWLKEDVCIYINNTHTHIHTHNGILLNHKKNEIMPFAAMCVSGSVVSDSLQPHRL